MTDLKTQKPPNLDLKQDTAEETSPGIKSAYKRLILMFLQLSADPSLVLFKLTFKKMSTIEQLSEKL